MECFENIRSFYWNKATRFNIVRSTTMFTFGYPNLMLSLLRYISFYFNINIATFVDFQIAVFAYVVHAAYFYIHKPKQPELTPSGRLVSIIFEGFMGDNPAKETDSTSK